eukprot:TRINITY_DN5731_c0_g1_i1.p2 TRINITY_DN5731_c0_g1~~TRINITY_DN5731_c0_g1_i1.p2  ORF type:complete len:177 (+),score=69.02 TRINITY_DN5731_c0_g1_i1:531-1061(+)
MEVVAVEGSAEACKAMNARLDAAPAEVAKRVTVLQQDFFQFMETKEAQAPFDFIYDRGSIVAIDPARREEYLRIINNVTRPGAACYLEGILRSPIYSGKQRGRIPPSNIEHAPYKQQPNMACGPPHHIPPSQVKALYDDGVAWRVAIDDDSLTDSAKVLSDESVPFGRYRIALERI